MAASLHSCMASVLASLDVFDADYVADAEVASTLVLINERKEDVEASIDLYVLPSNPLWLPDTCAVQWIDGRLYRCGFIPHRTSYAPKTGRFSRSHRSRHQNACSQRGRPLPTPRSSSRLRASMITTHARSDKLRRRTVGSHPCELRQHPCVHRPDRLLRVRMFR